MLLESVAPTTILSMTTNRRKKTSATATTKPATARESEDRHKEPREAFHLSEKLQAALERFRESKRPKPGKSEVMRTALEDYLEKEGFWPPTDGGGD